MTNDQFLEMKVKDLTPEALDLLKEFALRHLVYTPTPGLVKETFASKYQKFKAENVALLPATPQTKTQKALAVLARHPKGMTAQELAKATDDEVRLVYALVSNLKREGKVRWKDGRYYFVNGGKK